MQRWKLALPVVAIFAFTGCPPECPPGKVCGHGPKSTPEQQCAYELTCLYDPNPGFQGHFRVKGKPRHPNVKPALKFQVKADKAGMKECFLFSGETANFNWSIDGSEFEASVPLWIEGAAPAFPTGTISSSDPAGRCIDPDQVRGTGGPVDGFDVCRCQSQWP